QFFCASSGVAPYLLLPSFSNSVFTSASHLRNECSWSFAPMLSVIVVTGFSPLPMTLIASSEFSSCELVPPYSLWSGSLSTYLYAQGASPVVPSAAAICAESGPLPIIESVVSPGQPLLVSATPAGSVFR